MKLFSLTICIVFQCNILFSQVSVDSLSGHWKFDGNANDYSQYQNNGSIINGATYTYNRFNQANHAIKLVNSLQQYVDIPNNPALQIDSALTISFWAKRTTYGGGIVDQVLNKGGDFPSGTCNYGLVFSDNTLVFLHNNGYHAIAVPGIPSNLLIPYSGPYGSTLPGAPQDTLWHHYVVSTYNNSPIVYFYVDSLLVPTFWDGWGQNVVLNSNSTANLHIGGVNYYSNNIMDDIRIFRRTVTQNEVTALFNETCNTTSSVSFTACKSYTAPDGNIYTSSGIITATIPNAEGCDSIITINLTINTVDTIVNQNGITLTANNGNATYQWLDCNNGFAPISGFSSQFFTPTANGSYAVELTENGCVDTSACKNITSVGISENTFNSSINIYPNPTNGLLNIYCDNKLSNVQVIIYSAYGQVVNRNNYKSFKKIELDLPELAGIYFVDIISQDNKAIFKVIKR